MDEPSRLSPPPADEAGFPLTDLQEAYLVGMSPMLELGGFAPGFYFELDAVGLDPLRAQAVLNRLVERHEQLRTVVLRTGGQRVLPPGEMTAVRVPVTDLSGLDRARQHELVRCTADEMHEQGFDPSQWPLFQVRITRLRAHRCLVHMSMSLLLADAHSIWLLISEFQELHKQPQARLPAVSLTFRECVQAIAASKDSDSYLDQWRYWEKRLDTLPPAPDLPLCQPLSALGQVRFRRRECRLTAGEWQRLRARCQRHRLMPTATLAHVFAETLGAWAAGPRFCLNVLHLGWMNRHPQWTPVVGQLGATLPLEVDLGAGGDFWARGQRLQSQLWRDLENCEVTAVAIMRALAARRNWQPMLPYVFNGMLGQGAQTRGLPAGRLAASALRTPQVLIDNQVQDTPDGGMASVWDVVDDAFPDGLPDQLFDAYARALRRLSEAGDDRDDLDFVPLAHRQRVAAGNATSRAGQGRLETGFLASARRQPDQQAIIAPERTLTYGELERYSAAVAAGLISDGIGSGSVVAIVMSRGWEQVAAALGVLRAGAAYCPVDAGLPGARIRQLIEQCQAAAVLGQPELPEPGLAGADLADPPGDAADLAYVIYTSGSTGEPKGVMIEHSQAANTIADVNARIGLAGSDRVFAVSSMSFDLSVWDVFGTLAAGGALVLPAPAAAPDPVGWLAAGAAAGVTVWNSVPMLAELLAEAAQARPDEPRPPIRAFLLSGDWIPTSLPGRLRRLWPQARIIGLGGATEAAIWSNAFEIDAVDPDWTSVPYGWPLAGQTMRVLDHRLDLRPPWAIGRIYIGGAGVARGYLGDSERTAERFIRHPATGERLYWTGDLGRYREDGAIELLGREDRQLKLAGFRIEPGEVEAVARRCPGVRDCAAGAVAQAAGQRQLALLVVGEPGRHLDSTAVTAWLRERLPGYMVPAQVQVVTALPLTVNGKVDIAAAIAAGPACDPSASGGTATEGALTWRLTRLMAEILRVPDVGQDSNFFVHGGTSLLALRLVNRVRAELGADVPLGQFFASATPRALAASVTAGRPAGSLVRLTDRPGPELVLFHPVGGSVASYAGLSLAWPGPVRAFQSAALASGADQAPASLAAMADQYRRELSSAAPSGPYLLGGWSMGGVLAYEAGRQLAGAGHSVAVVLIDSRPGEAAADASAAAVHLAFLRDLAGGRLAESAAADLLAVPAADAARSGRDLAARLGLLPGDLDVAEYARLVQVHAGNSRALAGYRPAPSTIPVLLFLPSGGSSPRVSTADYWRAACSDLEVRYLPGDHYSLVGAARSEEIVSGIRVWAAGKLIGPALTV